MKKARIKEYCVIVFKESLKENGKYSSDAIREDYKNIKQIYELYDFNKVGVSIPIHVVNNAVESEY